MTIYTPGFYYHGTFIGGSPDSAKGYMEDMLTHEEVATFIQDYLLNDDCISETIHSHLCFILDHGIWAFIEDILEWMPSETWYGPIRYLKYEIEEVE